MGKEGWGFPVSCGKAHYFIRSMSLCGRHGYYFGPLEQGNDDNPDNCVMCRKKLQKKKMG